jgi:hypothetical protein
MIGLLDRLGFILFEHNRFITKQIVQTAISIVVKEVSWVKMVHPMR